MKNISQLINSQLTRSIKSNDKLSEFVYELLHLNKEKHNLWVVVKQQNLTLLTDNPYLGTQLSYQQEAICNGINKKFLFELKTSKVKIVPPTGNPVKMKKDLYQVSDRASGALAGIADEIDDEELKAALLKLTRKHDSLRE